MDEQGVYGVEPSLQKTFLRNDRLEGSHPLRDGDAIRLGLVALVFRRFEPGVSTETVATTR
jgi:hypothetical protein